MKESKLELNAKKLASRLGFIAYKGEGRIGAPDKIFIKGFYVFTVEFKKPGRKGGQSPQQKVEQEILEESGTDYHLCNNLDEFLEILKYHEQRYQDIMTLIRSTGDVITE